VYLLIREEISPFLFMYGRKRYLLDKIIHTYYSISVCIIEFSSIKKYCEFLKIRF